MSHHTVNSNSPTASVLTAEYTIPLTFKSVTKPVMRPPTAVKIPPCPRCGSRLFLETFIDRDPVQGRRVSYEWVCTVGCSRHYPLGTFITMAREHAPATV